MQAFVLSHSAFHGSLPPHPYRGNGLQSPRSSRPFTRFETDSRRPKSDSYNSTSIRSTSIPHISASSTPSSSDVLVIGGGAAGLSTAYELAGAGASVRVLSPSQRPPAMLAAAGMLAPLAENTSGAMHKLCAASLALYPSLIADLRRDVPHIDPQFRAQNHYLVPAIHGDRPPVSPHLNEVAAASSTTWLRSDAVAACEPALSPAVTEAARMPGDASVDNRRLHAALHEACVRRGVVFHDSIAQRVQTVASGHSVDAIVTGSGELLSAGHYVAATGAWTRSFLPGVPVDPIKGQMLSLRPPPRIDGLASSADDYAVGARLRHALFGKKVYIIPRNDDDLFIVGATVEPSAGFSFHNTAAGIKYLLDSAIELVPGFADYELVETWAGVRPATPDLLPIFGGTQCDNLSVVSGFHRYGILLTPIAGKLGAAVASGTQNELPVDMQGFLNQFSVGRFARSEFEKVSVIPLGTTRAVPPSVKTMSSQSSSKEQPMQNQTKTKIDQRENSTASERGETIDPLAGLPRTSNFAKSSNAPMMFRILEDGTQEPVEAPPDWTPKASSTATPGGRGNNVGFNSDPEEFIVQTGLSTPKKDDGPQTPNLTNPKSNLVPTVEKATTDNINETLSYSENVDNPELVSAVNDAYDDILEKANVKDGDAQARAVNRAFGRQQSSLQGDIVLSLSQADVECFDQAMEEGLKEMTEFASKFDQNDPSVIATKKDIELLETLESTGNLNGTAVLDPDVNQDFSDDGYF